MKTIQPNDIVLGYTLKNRIGSGGYGEVWSAEAPGGIAKAVKFVYGFHDEDRAKTELKSLDRIKQVRHPFLLSLERIQVVSGQLVVITELAERSLADLFRATKAAQGTGIPRPELLQYMRDAADGLDYLAQTHNLQHLDVKPENLLLLSGHVKIADFGLVKEVHEAAQSLMNGLTPIYAAPELFDGRPHRNSDQYSLAIVYQEMLTGTRPFTGSSAAQLAAQHINSRPSLQALPPGDQQVIARALSKDPNLRYASCREMVDELAERKSRVTSKRVRPTPDVRNDTAAGTYLLDDAQRRDFTAKVSESKFPHLASRMIHLPPMELAACQPALTPTLVIGVGRTAAMAMSHIRQRFIQQFGPAQKTPAVAFLCLDTDRQMLSKAAHNRTRPGLSDSEILPVPLKPSDQYRQDVKLKLNWLSRRWIYNIPRSGQTEGLRPLGRLAFADHSSEIFRRIKDSVSEIVKPEAVAATAEVVGMDPDPSRVNVYFVASSAGGVGSGMTIDLAYAIRTILSELGVDDARLSGFLVHCTPRGPNEQLLAIANSLSLMTEMRHINQYGYPGDDTCGMPRFENQHVFDDTYLMHLGDGLSAQAYDDSVNSIGDYIFLNIASRCQTFFDACRQEADSEIRSAQLRSFGLSQMNVFDEMSRMLAEALMQRWTNFEQAKVRLANSKVPQKIQEEQKLLFSQVRQRASNMARNRVETASAIWEQDTSEIRPKEADEETVSRVVRLAQGLFEQLGLAADIGNSAAAFELRTLIEKQGFQVGKDLSEHLWSLVSQSEFRLGGAKFATTEIIQMLREDLEKFQEGVRAVKEKQQVALQSLKSVFAPAKKSAPQPMTWTQWREHYFSACVDQLELELSAAFLGRVISALTETETALLAATGDMTRRFDDCLPLEKKDNGEEPRPELFPIPQIKAWIGERIGQLAERVDASLHHGWLHDSGGLLKVISDPLNTYSQLPTVLSATCNAVMSAVQREISIRDLAYVGGMSPAALNAWLAAQFDESKPQLADVGGEVRLLIAHSGNEETLETLRALKPENPLLPTLLEHAPGELVFCQELQKVPLVNLVYRMMERRADALDFVARLHTRTDIDWTSLNELFQMC